MVTEVSRRAVVASVATLPVATISTAAPDPVFAAIEHHRQLLSKHEAIERALADAVDSVWLSADGPPQGPHRPIALVSWRGHPGIAGTEIDQFRERLLSQPGANAREIEREYRKAKRTERELVR